MNTGIKILSPLEVAGFRDLAPTLAASHEALRASAFPPCMVRPRFKQGWNDRVRKTGEDYGAVYPSLMNSSVLIANRSEAQTWTRDERIDYRAGWEAAAAKIAELEIP